MKVEERFLKYVSFDTQSDEESETCPSSEKQKILGEYLAKELEEIGLKDARMDEHGYVYAYLPASEGIDTAAIGFIAHMDTSPSASGENIKAKTIKYEGGDIELSPHVYTKVADYPFLEKYVGQQLIVTDGTTLLGADDKAGVAEIVTAMEYLIAHPEIKHGKISVGFTPDEEIGRGSDLFDIKAFGCEYAYTVDGGSLGELEYENFNAAAVAVTFNGVNVHPGSAKNIMKNSLLMANDFINMLPENETPAHTENREGFFHVMDVRGDETKTILRMLIRDHDKVKFEERKALVRNICSSLNSKWSEGSCILDLRDSYYNMCEIIEQNMHVVERAKKAMAEAGVEPKIVPVRGGTDGARLSFEGLPCPNLFTGGENFHGVHEFVSVDAMKKAVEVIVNIAKCIEA